MNIHISFPMNCLVISFAYFFFFIRLKCFEAEMTEMTLRSSLSTKTISPLSFFFSVYIDFFLPSQGDFVLIFFFQFLSGHIIPDFSFMDSGFTFG